jgi:hypothetical protein
MIARLQRADRVLGVQGSWQHNVDDINSAVVSNEGCIAFPRRAVTKKSGRPAHFPPAFWLVIFA